MLLIGDPVKLYMHILMLYKWKVNLKFIITTVFGLFEYLMVNLDSITFVPNVFGMIPHPSLIILATYQIFLSIDNHVILVNEFQKEV